MPRHAPAAASRRARRARRADLPKRGLAVRGRLGLLAHDPLLYRELTGRENLRFHARLHGVARRPRRERCSAGRACARAPTSPCVLLSARHGPALAVCRAVLHRARAAAARRAAGQPRPRRRRLVEPLIGRSARAHASCSRPRPASTALAEADLALGLRDGRPLFVARATGEISRRARSRARSYATQDGRWRIVRKDLRLELRTRESVPAMVLFSLSTFVLFHFGLNRETVDGELAAGILWVTLLFAGDAGDEPAVRGRARGGRVRRLPARAGRPHRDVRGQGDGAVRLPRRGRGRWPMPGLRDPAARALAVAGAAGAARRSCCWPTSGSRSIGTLVGALAIQTRARDLIVPLICAAADPARGDRRRATRPRRCSPQRAPRRFRRAGWSSSVSMIWSSDCSPLRSSTSCWRTATRCSAGGFATLSIAIARSSSSAFALVFFYAPNDADQGFVQKIFYLHVPLAIVALGGFVAGGVYGRPVPAHRRPRAATCAPTWRSTCR